MVDHIQQKGTREFDLTHSGEQVARVMEERRHFLCRGDVKNVITQRNDLSALGMDCASCKYIARGCDSAEIRVFS